jgi:hypothetical protein
MSQTCFVAGPKGVYDSEYKDEIRNTIFSTTDRGSVSQAVNTLIQLEQKCLLRDKMRARLLVKKGLLKINK